MHRFPARIPWFVVIPLVVISDLPAQACISQGPLLSVSSERQGDITSVLLDGAPGSTGLFGIDVGGGPNAGICLDLSPSLLVFPIAIPASGQSVLLSDLLDPSPAASGFEVFGQAVLYDPSYIGGAALSNGTSVKLRPPHLAMSWNPQAFSFGGLASVNSLDGTLTTSRSLPTAVRGTSYDPVNNLVFVGEPSGRIAAYDGTTTQLVSSQTFPITGVASFIMRVTADGQHLVMRFIAPSSAQRLITLSLPSLSVVLDTVPGPTHGTFALDPNSTTVWMKGTATGTVQSFDYITGAPGPAVNVSQGHPVSTVIGLGDRLYVVTTDPAGTGVGNSYELNALEYATGTPLLATGAALPSNGYTPRMTLGIDPVTGADVPFLHLQNASPQFTSRIYRINPTTLQSAAFLDRPFEIDCMEVAPSGHLLVAQLGRLSTFGGAQAIHEDITPSLTVANTFMTNIPGNQAPIRIIRSDTLDIAYTAIDQQVMTIPVNPIGPAVATPAMLPATFTAVSSIYTE